MISIHLKKVCILFFAVVTSLYLIGSTYDSDIIANELDKPKSKWEKDITEFEKWDAKNSFPEDSVLFVGSSSIKSWETARYFSEFPVINRGFGGSTIYDVNLFVERIVIKYRPKVIVFYAGDNDIAKETSPETVKQNFSKFVQKVHNALPGTPVVFISIKPSGARWSLWPKMQKANSLISQYVAQNKKLYYLDLAAPLLDKNGRPDENLFVGDKLHLNEKGYDIWTKLLKSKLTEIVQL
ncbi:MAG: GDSL-type esterase/lipase family protein [Planctomycetota bacterium]|jgi:lysophospholipase L1-like esterase